MCSSERNYPKRIRTIQPFNHPLYPVCTTKSVVHRHRPPFSGKKSFGRSGRLESESDASGRGGSPAIHQVSLCFTEMDGMAMYGPLEDGTPRPLLVRSVHNLFPTRPTTHLRPLATGPGMTFTVLGQGSIDATELPEGQS